MLNGWYPGVGKLEISITSPSGLTTPFQRVITTGNFQREYQLSNARVVVETPGPDPDNGDHNFLVEIRHSNSNSAVPGGRWELRVKNANPLSGDLDVWILDDQDSPQVAGTGAAVADSHKIGSPGCASAALTAAAYVTRSEWQDIDGVDRAVGLALDSIADFSSEGPLRNGQRKPDVTAPGAMIVSCLSADSDAERSSLVDQRHLVEAGTSMACPFVAGVIALLLQRNPQLDPAAIKTALKSASRIPSKPAGQFEIKWGFGLIQVNKL
ncbi:MAG: S8 family serine peptidase [Pirellulales bacterium]